MALFIVTALKPSNLTKLLLLLLYRYVSRPYVSNLYARKHKVLSYLQDLSDPNFNRKLLGLTGILRPFSIPANALKQATIGTSPLKNSANLTILS
jgi:hypothetical protein